MLRKLRSQIVTLVAIVVGYLVANQPHQWVHWLDVSRHWLALSFNANAVGPNVGAGVWWAALVAAVSYGVWPKLRRAVNAYVERHKAHIIDTLKQHVTDEIDAKVAK